MEHGNLVVSFTMYGNPTKPNVTSAMEEETLEVVNIKGSSPFTYDYIAKLQNATRNQCGENMTFKTVGYNNLTLSFQTNVNVICK